MDWNLFVNGKFKFRTKINGYVHDLPLLGVWYNKVGECWILPDDEISIEPKDCTLIARPISDMTDEECDKFLKRPFPNDSELYDTMRDDWANNLAPTDRLSPSQFLGLLSIGVYPFDQSHFGDTVIDATTLEDTDE